MSLIEEIRLVGVFVGELTSAGSSVYAVYYGEDGEEFLGRRGDDSCWSIVSIKDAEGVETILAQPTEAPDPMEIARDLIVSSDGDIVI